ncbi:class I SAM-dependent methyltransferase [Larkinella bovis]|uniref:Class I SAM-dependent methyltransferase n=1 Tax=Larkinella bovis TaxID=683041 RepID=A0ABW0IAG7_9BACT
MKVLFGSIRFTLLLLLAGCGLSMGQQTGAVSGEQNGVYRYQKPANDGIGKTYLGREIAQVMGHLGAAWLERPEREQEERTDLLLDALSLKPTDVVADIGAGTGYFTFRMAPKVPKGKVVAVDIEPEMITDLNNTKKKTGQTNIETVLGTITDPKLAVGSIDLALMVDAYHEFSHPREMMTNIVRALKPGGRVVLVEYRAEDPNVPIKLHHKMSIAQATREMKAVGLSLKTVYRKLPQQHVMVFQR